MKTAREWKNYIKFKFWKSFISAIICYSPVSVLEYINVIVHIGLFAIQCTTFLDVKKINGVHTIKFNRNPITMTLIAIGKIFFVYSTMYFGPICKKNCHRQRQGGKLYKCP